MRCKICTVIFKEVNSRICKGFPVYRHAFNDLFYHIVLFTHLIEPFLNILNDSRYAFRYRCKAFGYFRYDYHEEYNDYSYKYCHRQYYSYRPPCTFFQLADRFSVFGPEKMLFYLFQRHIKQEYHNSGNYKRSHNTQQPAYEREHEVHMFQSEIHKYNAYRKTEYTNHCFFVQFH